MNHEDPSLPGRVQNSLSRGDGPAQQGHVVPERLTEAAGIHEVTLHVDDYQRDRLWVKLELVRFGIHSELHLQILSRHEARTRSVATRFLSPRSLVVLREVRE